MGADNAGDGQCGEPRTVSALKGRKCRCGFATLASRPRCPRCGKVTSEAQWEDEGKVLTVAKLRKVPDGFNVPMALTVVEIDGKGPKIACWTEDDLAVGDPVAVVDMGGSYICEAREQRPGPAQSPI